MVKNLALFILFLAILLPGCATETQKQQDIANEKKNIETEKDSLRFIYVGDYYDNPSVFLYDLKNKTSKVIWYRVNEKVVQLSYLPDKKNAFVLTASSFGKKGVYPFIKNVKLYMYYPDSEKVEFIKAIGSGMQLYVNWDKDENFNIVLNSIDKKISRHVNSHKLIFNKFGKEVFNQIKTFDIIKEGYPKPANKELQLQTEDGIYSILMQQDDSTAVYLLDNKSGEETLLAKEKMDLNSIAWNTKDKLLIYSFTDVTEENKTLYSSKPQTSKLFIYSLSDKKTLQKFNGGGYKNFMIIDDFLIFDDGFKKSSNIKIYDMKKNILLDTIKTNGGCGLHNIPEIPDYSA